jgi:hypothetical protein
MRAFLLAATLGVGLMAGSYPAGAGQTVPYCARKCDYLLGSGTDRFRACVDSCEGRVPPVSHAPPASSCTDCPTYKGEFSLENTSGAPINYQVKWGNGPWKSFTVKVGYTTTHSYGLDEDGEAPVPRVRFDRIGGDGAYTEQVYEMDFHKVGEGRGSPKKYVFRYAADKVHLDIKAK